MSLSRMPELHRAMTVHMPRSCFFPVMLEHLSANGCEFTAVDLIFQRVRGQRSVRSLPFQMRFVIWIYGKGDKTGLIVGIERPFWGRLLHDKHHFVHALQEMETLINQAVFEQLSSSPEKTLARTALGVRPNSRRTEKVAVHTAVMA